MEKCEESEREIEDDRELPNQGFTLGQHAVLVTTTGLSLLSGMATMMQIRAMFDSRARNFLGMSQGLGPIPGAVLIAFLSELNGRKVIMMLLSVLAALSSLILAIPSSAASVLIGSTVQVVVKGGVQVMTCITIAEYSSPRHRFAYLLANVAAPHVFGVSIVDALYNFEVLPAWSVYVHVTMIVLGLACAASTSAWPESPYWLAARGRGADAARALRRLRGGDAARELAQLRRVRRTPGPPSLYWKPLLIATIAISVCTVNVINDYLSITYTSRSEFFVSLKTSRLVEISVNIVNFATMILISYFVKRKILYLTGCGIPILFNFALGIWLWSGEAGSNKVFQVFTAIWNILRNSGIAGVGMAIFAEIVPYKYNTHMSCVCSAYFYVAVGFQTLIFAIVDDIYHYAFAFVLMVSIVSALGVGLVYWLAPETGRKSLFEIQASYTGQQPACPEQNETMMDDIPNSNKSDQ